MCDEISGVLNLILKYQIIEFLITNNLDEPLCGFVEVDASHNYIKHIHYL